VLTFYICFKELIQLPIGINLLESIPCHSNITIAKWFVLYKLVQTRSIIIGGCLLSSFTARGMCSFRTFDGQGKGSNFVILCRRLLWMAPLLVCSIKNMELYNFIHTADSFPNSSCIVWRWQFYLFNFGKYDKRQMLHCSLIDKLQ